MCIVYVDRDGKEVDILIEFRKRNKGANICYCPKGKHSTDDDVHKWIIDTIVNKFPEDKLCAPVPTIQSNT